MENQELIKIFEEFSFFADIHDEPFKRHAYERVAEYLAALGEDARGLYKREGRGGLFRIGGVGEGIADKIEEYFKTGAVKELKLFKRRFPVDIHGLLAVEGIGAKSIKILYEKLKIKNVANLEKAARAGKIRHLPRFGQKSEEKILKSIEFLRKTSGRQILGLVLPVIRELERKLQNNPLVLKVAVAGSARRMKETIGDIDVLAVSKNPQAVADFFAGLPEVGRVLGKGLTKVNVTLKNGLDADLRIVPEISFGSALNYFTGSKEHNVALRQLAVKNGWKLNEYGLFKGSKRIAGKSEEELYRAFGLNYIPPEIRENAGEIEDAKKRNFKDLIPYGSLKGDLQTQTSWTDGENTIEEMADAAIAMGLEYIAITDHTQALAMTGGADEKKLHRQMQAINALNEKYAKQKFRILKGAEVNIMKDGSLDISDDVLKRLDVVGVAVHTNFNMSEKEMTARIMRAMQNKNVDILFHPTGRVIGKREPYAVNMKEIIKTAKDTGTILEIDCYPSRSDLKDEYARMAVDADIKLAIDSDAHHQSHFAFLEYGIGIARRGFAKKQDVINTRPVEEMLKLLK